MKTPFAVLAISICLVGFSAATVAAPDISAGKAVFDRACAACHMPGGEGLPGVFPPVKKSDYVKKATPLQLVKVLDNGLTGEITVNGQKYNSAMPPLALSDEDTAAVLTYLIQGLNDGKTALTPEQVKRLRSGK